MILNELVTIINEKIDESWEIVFGLRIDDKEYRECERINDSHLLFVDREIAEEVAKETGALEYRTDGIYGRMYDCGTVNVCFIRKISESRADREVVISAIKELKRDPGKYLTLVSGSAWEIDAGINTVKFSGACYLTEPVCLHQFDLSEIEI